MFTWTCSYCHKKILAVHDKQEVIHDCKKSGKKIKFTKYTRKEL